MKSSKNNDCWDYIIVGAGSAGCVLANRLSADPTVNVLLLEAGHGFYDNILTRMPAGLMYLEGNPLFDWCYMMEPSAAIENRRERLSAGRVVGGGGTINGMVYLRGHPADYDGWAQAGCPGWSYADVLPYFKKIERTRLGDDEFHGRAGLLGVETPEHVMPVSKAFIAAARQAGMPLSDDINGPAPEGVAITPNSIWRGVRQSTAIAYLRPALRRPNLKMVTHALTTSLVMEGKHVRGVRYLHGGTLKVATTRREVLLAAGAVRTPQILMLSGIGPAEHLRTFGIDVVHDAPNVGQNLQDHPAIYLVHETTQRTWNQDLSLLGKFLHGARWLLTKGGPAASGPSQAVAFARSSSDAPRPDIQLTFAPVGYLYDGNAMILPRRNLTLVMVNACAPASRGSVRLGSNAMTDPPVIQPALLNAAEDMDVLLAGLDLTRHIFAQPPLADTILAELTPGAAIATADDARQWIRQTVKDTTHACGTCRMGSDPAAVVDPALRVNGVSGLRIADASVMPTITSGNTNAPTIMIAEKAADMAGGRPSL